MFVIVEHDISDPKNFWDKADDVSLPADLKLHQSMPNKTGTKAVCVWEANALEDVSRFVEQAVGGWSKNTYFAVEAEKALGLPVSMPA